MWVWMELAEGAEKLPAASCSLQRTGESGWPRERYLARVVAAGVSTGRAEVERHEVAVREQHWKTIHTKMRSVIDVQPAAPAPAAASADLLSLADDLLFLAADLLFLLLPTTYASPGTSSCIRQTYHRMSSL
jgi:hypothetical protein